MKSTRRIFTIILAVVCCGMTMFAQAPAKLNYQAVARNASNAVIQEQPVGVQVSILQGSIAGTAVYVETSTVKTNFDGLLSLTIGNGTPTKGSFTNIDWSKGPFFVQVAIDAKGGKNYVVMSTTQLLSVPYALYAEKSANAFSGEYKDLKNTPEIPTIPAKTSGYTNDVQYVDQEKQELSISGYNLSISEGNSIILPTSTTADFKDLKNHPEGKKTGDMLYWNAKTQQWDVLAAGKPGQVLANFDGERLAWGDIDSTGKVSAPNNCGTLVDYDKNEYKTIIINKKCWMAENLKVKHYSDGTALEVWTPTLRNTNYAKKYMYGEATHEIMGTQVYYLWYTATRVANNTDQSKKIQGICPVGWHVPSWVEFAEMFESIDPQWQRGTSTIRTQGGNQAQTTTSNNQLAIKLAAREGHWAAYNGPGKGTDVTTDDDVVNSPGYAFVNDPDNEKWKWNESGFSAIPAGYIIKDKTYATATAQAHWWFNGTLNLWTSISNGSTPNAVKIACYNSGVPLYTYSNEMKSGYSVRCVNDKTFE